MRFIYKPEGAEPREWDYNPDKFMNAEAEEIERRTGMTFGEWSEAVMKTSVRAIHGLLYVLLKRETPTLKWDQVVFSMSEIDLELTVEEKVAMRDEILKAIREGRLSEDESQAALDQLNAEIAGTEVPESAESDEDPKGEVVRTSDVSGSGPSLSTSTVPRLSGIA